MTDITEIKVHGYHTDLFGHVNHARYVEFLEGARWNFTEKYLDFEDMAKKGIAFVIVNINVNYRFPATLGQVLEIHSRVVKVGNGSGTVEQKIMLKNSDKIVADALVTFVLFDTKSNKTIPLKGEVGNLLRSLINEKA